MTDNDKMIELTENTNRRNLPLKDNLQKINLDEVNRYQNYSNQIEKDSGDDSELEGEGSFKMKLDQFLSNNFLKKIIEIISLVLAAVSYVIYIISTYFPEHKFRWFIYMEFGVCIYFNLETILNLYLAQHRISYLQQFHTIIDLFSSILPFFALIENFYLKKIVEFSRSLLIFRISKYFSKNLKINEDDVVRHILLMIFSFINLVLVFTCLFRIVEIDRINYYIASPDIRNDDFPSQTKFHDFLYFTIITLSTVGYGDIVPLNEIGRIVIILLILFTSYLVPKYTNELLVILENSSVYSRGIYKHNPEIPHLVICGDVSLDALKNFCNELFHVDHGQSDKNAVILNQSAPTQDMRLFLHAGEYEVNLKYLQGNPILEKNLDRSDISEAKASIIMTDKYTDDPHSTDHKNILMSLAIKKYFLQKQIYDSTLFIQLIKPENKIHYLSGLQSLSVGNKCSTDQVIIVEEIKMNLLSKSCLIPGIIPMITNLVRSSGSSDETDYVWLNEYLEGTGNEIYRAALNEAFKDNTFSKISEIIYEKYDAIAFALEIEVEGKTVISLNPGPFFIEKFVDAREDVKFYIYLICSDKEVADKIELADEDKGDDEEENEHDDEDNKEEDQPESVKYHEYMRLRIEDIQQLDDNNDMSNENPEEEDDYFIIKDFVYNNVDAKKDSIRNSSKYRNHIVVCGTHPSLYYYILPLRAKYLGKENLKYIVILTQEMPKDLWDSISRFKNILLVNGSPLNTEDLLRANIEYADKAVILENDGTKSNDYDNQMIDSETVFVYKAIKKCNPNIQIMTELVFDSNIEFLLPNDELKNFKNNGISYYSTSVFSAGEVYVSSIIDTLTCQAYYNKHIVTIIHQLLTGEKGSSNSTLKTICDNVGLKSSNLWQMDIPQCFINKTFIELYSAFCKKNIIVLGLYRLPGARDNNNPYVYTMPSKDTRLTHRDKLFILSIDKPAATFEEEEQNNEMSEFLKGDDKKDD
ncbi:MAG: ion channel, partial [archaeon]|nr:ion channel [archaeon]